MQGSVCMNIIYYSALVLGSALNLQETLLLKATIWVTLNQLQSLYVNQPAVHDGRVMLSILLLTEFDEWLLHPGPAPFTAGLSLFGWRVSRVTLALDLTIGLGNLNFLLRSL